MKRLLFTSLLLSALTLPCSLMAQDAKGKGKGKAKPKRPDAVGPAIGANVATPVSNIKTLPGFKVELIYSVPGGEGECGGEEKGAHAVSGPAAGAGVKAHGRVPA